MNALLNKLKSRKFWTAIVGIIVGISMIFGLNQEVIMQLSGAIMTLLSLGIYIITEGRNDYAGIITKTKESIEPIKKGIEVVKDMVEKEDDI